MPVLDRIVELQERRVTRDNFGSEVVSWFEIEKVWANVKQTGTSEDFENDANRAVALRNATFRIRWRQRRGGDLQGGLRRLPVGHQGHSGTWPAAGA